MLSNPNIAVDAVYRSDWGRIVATLIRQFGDFELAEDAAQDAFTAAVQECGGKGLENGRLEQLEAERKAANYDLMQRGG